MKRHLIVLLLLVLIGFFLRVYPFEAKSWVMDYDTGMARQALDLGQGILKGNSSFLQVLQERVEYPYFIPYLLLFCYGIFYFIGFWAGIFASSTQFVNFIFLHLNQFYWLSRILIAFFGTLSIPLVYLIVRQLFHGNKEKKIIWGSLLAAFLASFSLINVQFSQQVRPHVPIAFLILLSFYFYLLFLKNGRIKYFLLLAIVVGIATGTFISGAFAFIFLILSNYFIAQKNNIGFLKSLFNRRLLSGFFIFLVVIAVCCPYVFLGLRIKIGIGRDIDKESGLLFNLAIANFTVDTFGWGITTIFKVVFLSEVALGFLLIIFLFFYLLNRKSVPKEDNYFRRAIIGWWVFVIPYFIIFVLLDSGMRYRLLTPLVLFLCVGAGVIFIRVFDLIKNKKIIIATIIILLLCQMIQTIRLVQLMQRPYTRDQAISWIREKVPSSELVLFQNVFPNLTPTKESVKVQVMLRNGSLSRQDQFLLSLEDSEYPENSKEIIDVKSVIEYKNDNILEAYRFIRKIKPAYIVLSSRSLVSEKKENCFECQITQKYGQLIKKFTPFKKNQTERELAFPSGMHNPLIDLWVSWRLGPSIEIYKMNWPND